MTPGSQYTLILIYSNSNRQSLNVRIAVNEFLNSNLEQIDMIVREIEFELDRTEARDLGVLGTPTTLIFRDGELMRRHFGELTAEELKAIIWN